MMIVQIPDDIYSYEHKVIGNFTKRHLVCGGISLLIIFPIFIFIFFKTGSPRLAGFLSMAAAFPVLSCGVFKKNGLYPEQIIRYRFRQKFRYPQKRKFVMSNLYEIIQQNQKEYEAADEKQKANDLSKKKKGFRKIFFAMEKKKKRSGKRSI